MIVVGYGTNKPRDTYWFYNPKTWKIVESCDVKWSAWPNALTNHRTVNQSSLDNMDNFLIVDGSQVTILQLTQNPPPIIPQPISIQPPTIPQPRRSSRLIITPAPLQSKQPATPLHLPIIHEQPNSQALSTPAKRTRFKGTSTIPPPMSPMWGIFLATCALSPIVCRLSNRLLPLV